MFNKKKRVITLKKERDGKVFTANYIYTLNDRIDKTHLKEINKQKFSKQKKTILNIKK